MMKDSLFIYFNFRLINFYKILTKKFMKFGINCVLLIMNNNICIIILFY